MILLGLTGSVAAVLAPKLITALKRVDAQVEIVVTNKVWNFISRDEIFTLAKNIHEEHSEWEWGRDNRTLWQKDDPVLHIELRNRATDFVIAPLTANTMAKLANGICDNLLTSVVRAWGARRITIAPAMNTNMWEHPITAKHLETLRSFNYDIVMPQNKKLACGTEGMGAMANISDIVSRLFPHPTDKWWFPIYHCSGIPVTPHPGAFGYRRRDSGRDAQHNGIDLYTNEDQTVHAVEPGKIVSIEHFTGEWDNSPWWNNTDCVMVEGSSGVVCYGEVKVREGLKVGDYVRIGEYIANVQRVIKKGKEHPEIPGHSPSMLHLELYKAGTKHPTCEFIPELRDPTPFILESYNRVGSEVVYADYKPKDE